MPDIIFIQTYYEQMIGIMQISAALKAHGFTTGVALGTDDAVVRRVLEARPRVAGFYCTTGMNHKMLRVAGRIKKEGGGGVFTLFGGPHPTFVPEIVNEPGVDAVCRGEGEFSVLELMQALRDGRDFSGVPGLWVKRGEKVFKNPMRPLCRDLDLLPPADRELYRDVPAVYLQKRQEAVMGRGCPYSCTFCAARAFRDLHKGLGKYVRFRSTGNVIAELLEIKRRYNPSCFRFHDDIFVLDRDYCGDFLKEYGRRVAVPFTCYVKAGLLTGDLAGLMKRAGCYQTAFGVESGNERLRNIVLKKRVTRDQLVECSEIHRRYEIPFVTYNMVGLPGETLDNVRETVDLNAVLKPAWAWFSVYQPLPGTELALRAAEMTGERGDAVRPEDATFHESSGILRNHPDGRRILRLKNLANIMIKVPALKAPIERRAMNLPLDGALDLLDKALYFNFYYSRLTYGRGFFQSLPFALFLAAKRREFR
jgi:radical SAM superfamily enzyme YgiQ (UPF0313 family)